MALNSSNSCGGSVPELLQEVAGRLVSVEEGLAALDNHRTALHKHAHTVKGEISTVVERQLTLLRAREKHLLRQVELASSHQSCEVNVTQAQLLQHKGALAVTRTLLDNCSGVGGPQSAADSSTSLAKCGGGGGGGFSTVGNTIATTINCMPHQDVAGLLQHTEKLVRVPLVSVSVEEAALSSAIQRWGGVTLPPSLPHTELLPHCLEEYGDDEHHVLHKSVAREGSSTIDLRRPYLLAARKMAAKGGQQVQAVAVPVPPPTAAKQREDGGSSSRDELVRWLHRLQLDTSSDDDGGFAEVCVEDACQANEACPSFSTCLFSGQCKKSALEKLEQTSKWEQRQVVLCPLPEPPQLLQFPMDLSVATRKRHLSETSTTDAAKSVISHMTDILKSSNGSWLIKNNLGGKDFCNTLNKLSIENVITGLTESRTSTPVPGNVDFLKRQKCCQTDSGNTRRSARLAVMYQPPTSDWIISPQTDCTGRQQDCNKFESSAHPMQTTCPLAKTENIWEKTETDTTSWLLPLREDKPLHVATKKANCEMENNLCRASMLKNQLSITSLESMENFKDKVEKASPDYPKYKSDIEEKESWLLQQCATLRADNKVLEEVMANKSQWLSDSSLASFSIISDPEVQSNSWLMAQVL